MNRIVSFLRRLSGHRAAGVIALLAALCAMPTAAQAQSTASVEAKLALIQPLRLTKIEDLDFGHLVVTTGGTVVMDPTSEPTCTTSGGVVHSAECQPAVFGGSGQFGQRVRIRRPIGRTITLTGPGADMIVTDLVINGDPMLQPVQSNPNWERFLINDQSGIFLFRVGGTLNVNPAQLPGVYTGTFDIRIDYQ